MSVQAAPPRQSGGVSLARYAPLALVVTVVVTLVPLGAVTLLGPARSPLAVSLHVLAAVLLSIVLARAGAALWTRYGKASSDLVFGDLLLWGWARRAIAERRLERASRELVSGRDAGVPRLQRLSRLLEARDPYTHGHSKRVARHCERIARNMGQPRAAVAQIRAAALVHDVGKINTPRSILTKPGKLTDAEFDVVKLHAGDGAAMVAELGDPELASIVRHHHERLDGTGYPDGLAGYDIPIGARIIAVADTFDAITSTRPYRKACTHKQAMDVLRAEAGTQLDGDAVAAFDSYYAGRKTVAWVALLAAAPQRLLSGIGGVPQGLAAGAAPIAQAACSVGGIALVGACLGGSLFSGAAPDEDGRAVPAAKLTPGAQAAAGSTADRPLVAPADRKAVSRRRVRLRSRQRSSLGGSPESVLPTRDGRAPRALQPTQPPAGGGGRERDRPATGGLPDDDVVAVPDVRALLPDPAEVLRPVTEIEVPGVPLPDVKAPELGLP